MTSTTLVVDETKFDDHSYGPVDIDKVGCMKVRWWHARHRMLAVR